MSKFASLLVVALVLPAASALAADSGGSNIALTEYPGPKCVRPHLDKSGSGSNAQLMGAGAVGANVGMLGSDAKIKQYNALMDVYNSCLRAYVENGNADMKRIQDRVQAAIDEAKAP